MGDQQAKRSYERDVAAAERLSGSAKTSVQQTVRPPEAPGGAPPAPAIPTPRSSQVGSKSEGNVNGKFDLSCIVVRAVVWFL